MKQDQINLVYSHYDRMIVGGVVPGKNKTRTTKSGFIAGRKPAYKKAFVTVAEGETIDLYTTI